MFADEGRMLRYRNLNQQADIVLEEFHKMFKPEIDKMVGNWKKNISQRYGRNIDTSEEKLSAAIYDVLHKVLFRYHPFAGDVENYFNAYATKEKIGHAKKEVNDRLKLTGVPKSNDKKWKDLSLEEKEEKGRGYFQFGENHEGKILLETETRGKNEEGDITIFDLIGTETINPALSLKMRKEYDNLPEDARKIIEYRFVEGLDYEKIADIMGINADNSRQIYHRTMKELLKVLSETSVFFKKEGF
jgi:RNA polymerase sigma factor (sigma-70 family)